MWLDQLVLSLTRLVTSWLFVWGRFSGGCALNQCGLTKNDSVVLSSEDGRYIALSTGFIRGVTESVLDVVVDR